MDDFKNARTLYDDNKRKGNSASRDPPTNIVTHKCEHHSKEGCEIRREAVKLGLAKTVFPCTGNIPPDCDIRKRLKAGKTVQEIYQK